MHEFAAYIKTAIFTNSQFCNIHKHHELHNFKLTQFTISPKLTNRHFTNNSNSQRSQIHTHDNFTIFMTFKKEYIRDIHTNQNVALPQHNTQTAISQQMLMYGFAAFTKITTIANSQIYNIQKHLESFFFKIAQSEKLQNSQ